MSLGAGTTRPGEAWTVALCATRHRPASTPMALEIACPACQAPLRVREAYAGKSLKCPRCAAVVKVPATPGADEQAPVQVRPVVRGAPPPVRAAVTDDTDQITVDEPRRALPAGAPATRCPRCGEKLAAGASRCRYCRAWLDEDEQEADDFRRPRHDFKPCPRCGATGAERVTWTPWGSFYGPALFTHVRCRECGYGYNGRTGRSNLVPAIFMVTIPLVLIVAILLGLWLVLTRRW